MQKKLSRLACIESEEPGLSMFFDQDSLSCDNDIQGGEEDVSDNEGELTCLINRIEFMKKERPKLWLEEFKDWMDQGSENWVDEYKNDQATLPFSSRNLGDTSSWRQSGESSRYLEYVSDSTINSGDYKSATAQETNSSFAISSAGNHDYHWLHFADENGERKPRIMLRALDEDLLSSNFPKGKKYLQIADINIATVGTSVQDGDEINAGVSSTSLTAIKSIKDLSSSSGHPESPPHYEEDILNRRHYLEEEFLQVSAESFSAASSDSNTSCDEADGHECGPSFPEIEQYTGEESLARNINWKSNLLVRKGDNELHLPEVGREWGSIDSFAQQPTRIFAGNDEDFMISSKQAADCYETKASKRKPRKRVVSLSDSTSFCEDDIKNGEQKQDVNDINCIERAREKIKTVPAHVEAGGVLAHSELADSKAEDHIASYFNSLVADSTIHETCKQYIVCNCVVGRNPMWSER